MKNSAQRAVFALAISVTLATLTGCGTTIRAVKGYEAVVDQDVKEAADFAVRVWTKAACLTPIDAATRNPEIIPALKELCRGLKESVLFEAKK
jgi:hypothetical protein